MKIGVDAASLNSGQSGNYYLTYNLLLALSLLDHTNEYVLYSQEPIAKSLLKTFGKNFHNKVLKPKKFWMQLRLSWEQVKNPVDVFVGLNQALPLFVSSKSVVFILDLAIEKYRHFFANGKLSWQSRRAVQKADKIIAISQATKRDLIQLYEVKEDKIKMIYPGV